MEKSTPLWCDDCRFVTFETGLGKPMLTLNDPNGFKNSTNVYSIHLELWMALPCQISTGKWKYVNPCLNFLGIPDQRTAYVKWQARPRWTYVRRSSVTPDLLTAQDALTISIRILGVKNTLVKSIPHFSVTNELRCAKSIPHYRVCISDSRSLGCGTGISGFWDLDNGPRLRGWQCQNFASSIRPSWSHRVAEVLGKIRWL